MHGIALVEARNARQNDLNVFIDEYCRLLYQSWVGTTLNDILPIVTSDLAIMILCEGIWRQKTGFHNE